MPLASTLNETRSCETTVSSGRTCSDWQCNRLTLGTELRQPSRRRQDANMDTVSIIKAMVFFSSHVRMWELDHKEVWAPKNWCFQIVVLEKTLESPLDKKIKPVHPKENQPWIFIGRALAKAEAPILWPPDVKSWLIGKDPDAGKDWTQKEKRVAEDELGR